MNRAPAPPVSWHSGRGHDAFQQDADNPPESQLRTRSGNPAANRLVIRQCSCCHGCHETAPQWLLPRPVNHPACCHLERYRDDQMMWCIRSMPVRPDPALSTNKYDPGQDAARSDRVFAAIQTKAHFVPPAQPGSDFETGGDAYSPCRE